MTPTPTPIPTEPPPIPAMNPPTKGSYSAAMRPAQMGQLITLAAVPRATTIASLSMASPAATAKPATVSTPRHGAPDFERIKEAAVASAESLLREWFPAGRMVGHEFKIGSLAGERGSSLSINVLTGKWKDFAAEGQSGNDLISLLAAKAYSGQQGEAARRIAERLGIAPYRNGGDHTPAPKSAPARPKPVLMPIFPPSDSAGPPPADMLAGFDMLHQYTDLSGAATHYVGRIEARGGARKVFVPISYGMAGGITGWHKLGLTGPLPLYGLHRLTDMPTAPVVLVEGEKKCDIAQAMIPTIAFLSWCRGSSSDGAADLTPLAGHDIMAVWGDADEPGRAAALRLASRLGGTPIVQNDDLADGFDAADLAKLVASGAVADPYAWLRARIKVPEQQDEAELAADQLRKLTSARTLITRLLPPDENILGSFITRGARVFVVAPSGLGKTMMALAMAGGIASGQGFLHWQVDRPMRVLFIDGEMPLRTLQRRVTDMVRRSGMDRAATDRLHPVSWQEAAALGLGPWHPLNTEQGRDFVLRLCDIIEPDVVFLDNVQALVAGEMKEEAPWKLTAPLVAGLTERDIAQVWIDHMGHDFTKQYGTSTKGWPFDTVALMMPLPAAQLAPREIAFTLSFESPGGKTRNRTPENWDEFATKVIRLRDDQWSTNVTSSSKRLSQNEQTALRFLADLIVAEGAPLPATSGFPSLSLQGVPEGRWRKECETRGLSDAGQKDSRTTLFRRCRAALVSKQVIACRDKLVWITRPESDPQA